jgi:hypothetical protein
MIPAYQGEPLVEGGEIQGIAALANNCAKALNQGKLFGCLRGSAQIKKRITKLSDLWEKKRKSPANPAAAKKKAKLCQ